MGAQRTKKDVVKLVAPGGNSVECPRSVLAACSAHFAAALRGPWTESQSGVFVFDDLESSDLQRYVDLCHRRALLGFGWPLRLPMRLHLRLRDTFVLWVLSDRFLDTKARLACRKAIDDDLPLMADGKEIVQCPDDDRREGMRRQLEDIDSFWKTPKAPRLPEPTAVKRWKDMVVNALAALESGKPYKPRIPWRQRRAIVTDVDL